VKETPVVLCNVRVRGFEFREMPSVTSYLIFLQASFYLHIATWLLEHLVSC